MPPILALVAALTGRGHGVTVLAHNVQRSKIEAAGATFLAYQTARQIDHGRSLPLGENPLAALGAIDKDAANDLLATSSRLAPDAVLVDCMLPATLTAAKASGRPTVALVHILYSCAVEFAAGLFRGPIDQADLALGLTYASLDDAPMAAPNLVFVGPARPPPQKSTWRRRLPNAPLVVASLSTGLQGKPGTQLNLLQRVCDALAPLEVESLVTTGRGIAPEDIVAGPNTTVERFASHDVVLAEASLFITHAGHGSIAAGVAAGIPLLCLPPGGDQPFNAARVATLGLGEVLDPASSSEHIGLAVERMIADPKQRERSRKFASHLAAHPGIELALDQVEAIAALRDGAPAA